MSQAPIELIQVRIATPGWTPGKKDIADLFSVWRELSESERDAMIKRLAKLDAPSVKRASELFAELDDRSRGELARPLLKSFLKVSETSDLFAESSWVKHCLSDQSARVRYQRHQSEESIRPITFRSINHSNGFK
jgi:hypothetical protein